MEYALVTKNYGQGGNAVILPAARCTPVASDERTHPYSVLDIIQLGLGDDYGLLLQNYIRQEKKEIQSGGILPDAESLELVNWNCYKTLSRLQQPTEATVVDFLVRALISGAEKSGLVKRQSTVFRIRYILDLRPCHQRGVGPLIWLNHRMPEDPIMSAYWVETNEYLLPILRAEDYERIAHEMLDRYFPENRRALGGDATIVDAEELAKRMGLSIMEVHFADRTIMGQVYYDYGTVDLVDAYEEEFRMEVKPATILVSLDNCTSRAVRNSTIVHECCHMYLDRWFFLLQMMAGHPHRAYSSRRKENRRNLHLGKAIEWMEKQCEKLPAFLLMERDDTISYIKDTLSRHGGLRTPERIRNMIEMLAERNGVSFAMARCRMIELGFYEAEGIRNYVNGGVVPDHGCGGKWPEKATFTISLQDASKLAAEDSTFDRLLRSGRYCYVEGHFCLNQADYRYADASGRLHLTTYARCHMDECCLSFRVEGCRMRGVFRQGAVYRKVTGENRYLPGYSLEAEPGTAAYDRENDTLAADTLLWRDLYLSMPDNFGGAIKEVLKRKGVTQEELAGRLGVSNKAVYNYLNADQPSLAHIVGICVALKLPYFISMELIENAGYRLRRTEADFMYRQFLLQTDQLTVARCEDILQRQGYPPLFRGEGNERNLPSKPAMGQLKPARA